MLIHYKLSVTGHPASEPSDHVASRLYGLRSSGSWELVKSLVSGPPSSAFQSISESSHWYVEIIPRLVTSGGFAGFEYGSGMFRYVVFSGSFHFTYHYVEIVYLCFCLLIICSS